MTTYRVTRKTLMVQSFTVNAATRREALDAVRDLDTEHDTEEWDDERIVSASQSIAPTRATYTAIVQEG